MMENQVILNDTIRAIKQTIELGPIQESSSVLNTICDISMLVIALANIVFVIYMFVKGHKNDVDAEERARKIDLLKTLVLDYNMEKFYSYFSKITKKVNDLKKSNINDGIKTEVNDYIMDEAIIVRQEFLVLLAAIDKKLYDSMLHQLDLLNDHLTNTIFDKGYNLSDDKKFKELITDHISDAEIALIKILFNYKG